MSKGRQPNSLKSEWLIDPSVTFLNHGSFGACPRVVLDAQQAFRERMERQPMRFFIRDHEELLDAARADVAGFIGADASDVAFVANATAGINSVVRSLDFAPGDELLTTDHAYNACRNALVAAAERSGARVVVASVPFPLRGPDDVVEAILARVTERTRLAMVDHVTSQSALVWPIARIVAELAKRGVDSLIDGAHAPGMVPIDVEAIGAAYYTANCHKWLCAPKGAGLLHVRRDKQRSVRPLSISHGANATRTDRSRFLLEFDWTGTVDPSPWLCVPHAIRFLDRLLPGGMAELMERNHRQAVEARQILCKALGVEPPCPETMIGSMASVLLPPAMKIVSAPRQAPGEPVRAFAFMHPLQEALSARFAIEAPVFVWAAGPILRVCAQAYNEVSEYTRLADALGQLLEAKARPR